jgi:hypothetical protein
MKPVIAVFLLNTLAQRVLFGVNASSTGCGYRHDAE